MGVGLHPFEVTGLFTKIVWNEVCFFSIYSVTYLYQSGLLDVYFSTWSYNSVLCYLFGWLNCSSFGHRRSFRWLLCPFDMPPSLWVKKKIFFFSMSVLCFVYFLALQDALGSCTFAAPVLELAISPKTSHSFYWRSELETKTWAPSG